MKIGCFAIKPNIFKKILFFYVTATKASVFTALHPDYHPLNIKIILRITFFFFCT